MRVSGKVGSALLGAVMVTALVGLFASFAAKSLFARALAQRKVRAAVDRGKAAEGAYLLLHSCLAEHWDLEDATLPKAFEACSGRLGALKANGGTQGLSFSLAGSGMPFTVQVRALDPEEPRPSP